MIAERFELPCYPLTTPIEARNLDGTSNKQGHITHAINVNLRIGPQVEIIELKILDTERDEAVLGHPWIHLHNPRID